MTTLPLADSAERLDTAGALARVAPFSELPPPVLKAIADLSQTRSYRAGEAVLSFGQFDGSEFFLVVSGRLRAAYAGSGDGAGSMHVEEIAQGAFFGLAEAVAFEENPRAESVTLTAEADSDVVVVDAPLFRALAAQRPSLTRALLTFFAQAMCRIGVPAAPQEATPERRVFAALLSYVVRDAATGSWRIPRMPKHRELAEKAGADEASAAAAVAQLIQGGAARRDYPGLVIDDLPHLNRLAS